MFILPQHPGDPWDEAFAVPRTEGPSDARRVEWVTQAAVRYAGGHINLGEFVRETCEAVGLATRVEPEPDASEPEGDVPEWPNAAYWKARALAAEQLRRSLVADAEQRMAFRAAAQPSEPEGDVLRQVAEEISEALHRARYGDQAGGVSDRVLNDEARRLASHAAAGRERDEAWRYPQEGDRVQAANAFNRPTGTVVKVVAATHCIVHVRWDNGVTTEVNFSQCDPEGLRVLGTDAAQQGGADHVE